MSWSRQRRTCSRSSRRSTCSLTSSKARGLRADAGLVVAHGGRLRGADPVHRPAVRQRHDPGHGAALPRSRSAPRNATPRSAPPGRPPRTGPGPAPPGGPGPARPRPRRCKASRTRAGRPGRPGRAGTPGPRAAVPGRPRPAADCCHAHGHLRFDNAFTGSFGARRPRIGPCFRPLTLSGYIVRAGPRPACTRPARDRPRTRPAGRVRGRRPSRHRTAAARRPYGRGSKQAGGARRSLPRTDQSAPPAAPNDSRSARCRSGRTRGEMGRDGRRAHRHPAARRTDRAVKGPEQRRRADHRAGAGRLHGGHRGASRRGGGGGAAALWPVSPVRRRC